MEIKKGEDKAYIKIEERYDGRDYVADVTVKEGEQEAKITVPIQFLVKVVAALTASYLIFSNLF